MEFLAEAAMAEPPKAAAVDIVGCKIELALLVKPRERNFVGVKFGERGGGLEVVVQRRGAGEEGVRRNSLCITFFKHFTFAFNFSFFLQNFFLGNSDCARAGSRNQGFWVMVEGVLEVEERRVEFLGLFFWERG